MQIDHDMQLDIAVGTSRKTKQWKNKRYSWSNILDRLANTTRTAETMAEYKAMGKERQSDIKDVGGFVGGYCDNGSRTNVRFRSIVCLDADYADKEIWNDFKSVFDNAAAIYSTHKHTPEKNRLRLVIPLSRTVTGDEYQAVARKIAATLDIDKFDDTTYDVGRLMYWPSTSQDGEFFFDFVDAKFLNPDNILQTYHDWTQVSEWPMSSRVADIVRKSGKKAQDPIEKSGLVGAFCRAYSIEEAIANFVPEYAPTSDKNRYTYVNGSTAGGVIIYDGKFSFSHHATDPTSGVLCNSWDLVRLHKFGALDGNVDPETKVSSRPSYKAMTAFAMEDKRVRTQAVTDRMEEALADFSVDLPEEEMPEDWKSLLKVTERNQLVQSIENAVIILQHDPELKGALAYNEMDHNIILTRPVPWRDLKNGEVWIDSDDAALRYYLERVYGLSTKDKIFDAVNVVAVQHGFHPVKQYLETCTWDGTPRLDTLLVDYLGAEDTEYTRAVTRKAFIAAVARIYKPGCKYDYMLTIKGRQGLGKSTIVAKMGGEWFSDTFSTMQGKEAYEQLQGVWIMEVGELAGMKKTETEGIKQYISKQSDRFRPAYGRRLQEFPRQCIFVGTTNEDGFLRDTTGNRRFWIVDTPNKPTFSVWDDLTDEVVKQVWGEAIDGFNKGEELFLPSKLEREAREVQSAFEEENPKKGLIEAFLDRKLPSGWEDMDLYDRRQWLDSGQNGTEDRQIVCNFEIYAELLGGNMDKVDRYAVNELRAIMANIDGWERAPGTFRFKQYGKQRYYRRKKDANDS